MKNSIVQFRQAAKLLPCALFTVVSFAMLAGCNVGPKYVPPAMTAPPAFKESPEQFKETEGWTVAQPQDATLRGKWWEIYNDPELNALEEQLNVDNQNIRVAFENFMEARALVRQARSQFFPTIGIGPSYTRTQTSSTITSSGSASSSKGSPGSNSTASSTGIQSQIFALPAEASWEPDLWDKVRNTVRVNQYQAQLTAADLENERLTEQASLAEFFFEIRGQDALQKILDDLVETDKKDVEAEQSRYDTGVDDQIALVQAQTNLASAQSAAINLGIARAQFEHAIAMLIGKPASSFSIPVKPSLTEPPPIPVGLPSQLLERRPDVAGAERSMAAANAQIGVAYAAYYPSLTLSGSGGVESSAIKNLLDSASRFWSVGPSLSETIYDGGLRRATVNQFIATYNADLATYRQSVLVALQQVEDDLAAVRILSQQIKRQQEAVDSSEKYVSLEQTRYDTGVDPYIDLAAAQVTLSSNQQALASLKIQEMTSSVELIQALGGGWDKTQLPTPEQITQKPTHAETTIQH
ncbi:MAG: efflux transporter outer membrane subunit [Terracidiphilus sp.]|jgi:NodT family efflux transporter outer membrane factor (OMF) lipoprotein